MKRTLAVLAAAGAVALTAGCATDFRNTPIPSNTPRTIAPSLAADGTTITPSATPESGYNPVNDGQRFVNVLCGSKSARDAFDQLSNDFFRKDVGTMAAMQEQAGTYALTLINEAAKLRAEQWPPSVQPAIERLAASVEERSEIIDKLANAQTKAAAEKAWLARNTGGAQIIADVEEIRTALNLPPDDGSCPA